MAGLPGKISLRSSAAILALFFGLLLLSGCGSEGYPENLKYTRRTDPLPANPPDKDAPNFDRPGEFPEVLFAGLSAAERGKLLVDPSKLKEDQRDALDQALTEIFGTPAHPTVAAGADAAETVKRLKLDDDALATGSKQFRHQCLHCHGLNGDGRGPTAPWVNPHPRDYRQGRFKFTSSSQQEGVRKPRRDDLLRTMREGIDGTSMPSFRLLPDEDLEALASYVILLSLRGQTEFKVLKAAISEEGLGDQTIEAAVKDTLVDLLGEWQKAEESAIQAGPHPDPANEKDMEQSVQRGFDLFVRAKAESGKKSAGCISCHIDFGRQSAFKYDAWGTIVRPADLTVGTYRGGRRPIDLYWRIHSGINGVNMPASKDNLDAKDIWDLVNFLRVLPYPAMREHYRLPDLESKETVQVAAGP